MGMDFTQIKKYTQFIKITDDLLEIGSDGGEGSTKILAELSLENKKTLYSVDFNEDTINKNVEIYNDLPVSFHIKKGEDFLDENKNLKFSVVLLDNFDWNYWLNETTPDFVVEQINYYNSIQNIEMNNINSQIAHLTQAIKLTKMLSEECIVICDDTSMNDDHTYSGKCGAAVIYLISIGFIVFQENSGLVCLRNKKKLI
jgi:hypothetical protein